MTAARWLSAGDVVACSDDHDDAMPDGLLNLLAVIESRRPPWQLEPDTLTGHRVASRRRRAR